MHTLSGALGFRTVKFSASACLAAQVVTEVCLRCDARFCGCIKYLSAFVSESVPSDPAQVVQMVIEAMKSENLLMDKSVALFGWSYGARLRLALSPTRMAGSILLAV